MAGGAGMGEESGADRDQRIDQLRAEHTEAPAGSPAAARLANTLGRLLAHRYFRGGAPADRDAAIDLLDQTLAVPHDDPTVIHAALGMLLVFRAMPIPLGGDPDGRAAIALGMALMTGTLNEPARLVDRDRAVAHLRWIVTHELPDAPMRVHAQLLIAMLGLMDTADLGGLMAAIAGLAGGPGGLDGHQRALVELLVATIDDSDPHRAWTAFDVLLRQLPAGHRLRPMVLAEMGSLLARRGHLANLPADLAGLAGVLRDVLDEMGKGEPLHVSTVRVLAGTLLSATAYTGDDDGVTRIVEIADELVTSAVGGDPVTLGRERFLRAMALTLRGRRNGGREGLADLAAAADDLRAALDAAPAHDELRPAIAGMLGALLNDRYLMQNMLADLPAAAALLAGARRSLDQFDGTDRAVLTLAGLMSRVALAVRQRDAVELDDVIRSLAVGLADVPTDYPWRSRLDAAFGLAHLARGILRQSLDDLRAGIVLLGRAGDDLAVEVSGRPAMRAAGALGRLLDGLLHGDRTAVEEAGRQVAEAAADPDVPMADRIAFAALEAQAAAIRGDDASVAVARLEHIHDRLIATNLPHPLAAQISAQLAHAYRAAGRGPDSIDSGLDALRAYADDVVLQSGTHHALDAARDAAGLARQIADWCVDDDRPDRAIEAIELGRALVLHSATVAATVPDLLRSAGRPDLADEWRPLSDGRAVAVAEIAGELVGIPSDLRPRTLAALRDVPGPNPLSTVPDAEEIAAAAQAASADAVVYLLGGDDRRAGRLILVGADGAVRCRSAGQLRRDAVAVQDYLTAPHVGERARDLPPQKAFREWAEPLTAVCEWAWPALIEPLLAEFGPDGPHRLVLIAADGLGYVPWHAARTAAPGGPVRFALEEFAFSYAASARQFAAVACRPARSEDGSVVLVANPNGDLPGAAAEVKTLRDAVYPGATVLAARDDVLWALTADPAPKLLHLACHARVGATPDASHLVLAGHETLSVTDILAAARTRAAAATGGLVVLSACGTDLTGMAFDEALTLATAFLAAGAVGVVGSRWPIDDSSTACFMVMFHRYRTTDGIGARDALRAAQRWMLDHDRQVPPELAALLPDNPAALADPAIWAAFTHHGR